jgi:two-component system sensor histidine kinase KdpD
VIGAENISVDGKPFGEPFVRVYIDDNGPGLPANMEDRVFEKFTRGEKESAKPGIGLGLSICRAIVEAHGGTIGANNRRNEAMPDAQIEGARFWFTLPVEPSPPVPSFSDEAEQDFADFPPSDTKSA